MRRVDIRMTADPEKTSAFHEAPAAAGATPAGTTLPASAAWRATLDAAVAAAGQAWLAGRRTRVAPFARRHFGWRGAWRLNRRAFGKDLLRAPVNVLWAAPHLLLQLGARAGRKAGLKRTAERLEQLPAGWRTDVERELEWLIRTELLELPCTQPGRTSPRDTLFEAVLAQPAVAGALVEALQALDALGQRTELHGRLADFLRQYTDTRAAAADLANSLLALAAGAAAFQSFTPGTVAMGAAAAAGIAQQLAVANFTLGPTLGALWYGVFPASASAGLVAATTGGLMAALGVLAACSGLVTDPLQQALGLHERRLHKLLDALDAELAGQSPRGPALRDAYVARVFDLLDLIQTAAKALR